MISIYSDAARDDTVAGLGYVICGDMEHSGKKYLLGHYTSMEAEYHAMLEALRQAQIHSDEAETVTMYIDVAPLRGKMLAAEHKQEKWAERQRSFEWLANKFNSWELECVGREGNEDAHRLAREALFEGREV